MIEFNTDYHNIHISMQPNAANTNNSKAEFTYHAPLTDGLCRIQLLHYAIQIPRVRIALVAARATLALVLQIALKPCCLGGCLSRSVAIVW